MKTWILAALALVGASATVNGPTHAGRTIECDLADSLQLRNTGGSDGQGLCVPTSLTQAARYQNCRELADLQAKQKREPGGGWPDRVAQWIRRDAPNVGLVQYQGAKEDFLDRLISTGRMPCTTYNWGERYGQTIAHCVNLVYLDAQWAAILDNNFPKTYEWMPRAEFFRRAKHPRGSYWAFGILSPPPPPPPID